MSHSHKTPCILLVDDEPATLQLIRKILQADGYQIVQAVDGLDALERIAQYVPDLILLDVVMPRMDGMAVLRKLREQDKVTGVIMASALTSENLVVQAMLDGADDFVSKPFTLKNMRVRIRQTLEKSRLRRENVHLQRELQVAHDKIRTILGRYMAAPVLERLLASPTLPSLGGERQIATVLFMDFCDFTPLSHELEPDRVLDILNDHLALATAAIQAEEGTIDKYVGDGIMALFNAPVAQSDHPLRAVRAALALRDSVAAWAAHHQPSLNVRVGIHTGETVVGNIGTPELMNYTAIGDAVNLAKRLQEEGDDNAIIASESTVQLLPPDWVDIAPQGSRTVKGRQRPVAIYQLNRLR
ncbi:MAG TPA: adenylate/guanylate cyclase domain-containing protein [Caldilineaceae bacterium]|nr:adenylate/guanylate cyclase domain-containing protein [Caldilineaceae bacterium]